MGRAHLARDPRQRGARAGAQAALQGTETRDVRAGGLLRHARHAQLARAARRVRSHLDDAPLRPTTRGVHGVLQVEQARGVRPSGPCGPDDIRAGAPRLADGGISVRQQGVLGVPQRAASCRGHVRRLRVRRGVPRARVLDGDEAVRGVGRQRRRVRRVGGADGDRREDAG